MPGRISIDRNDLLIIGILNSLARTESITTYAIGKKIFGKGRDAYESRKWDNFVRSRLEKLQDYDLIEIHKEGKTTTYMLLSANVSCRALLDEKLGIRQRSWFLRINGSWCVFPCE
jgi:hypothetical protein